MRDKLFILETGFKDPAYPNKTFYCWHCVLMEGLLASFPAMAGKLDVERISWPRPRKELVDLLGPEFQTVPVLILANEPPGGIEYKTHNGVRFVDDKDAILHALSLVYDVPHPHP